MKSNNSEGSIVTNLLSLFTVTAAMMVSLTAGLLLPHSAVLVAYVFPIIYFIFYFVTMADGFPFPMYFFIAMVFVIGNNASLPSGSLPIMIIVEIGITALVMILNFILNVHKKLPFLPEESLWKSIRERYHNFLRNDPKAPLRTLIHCLILFIAGFTGYLLSDYRGKWVLLACGCVLIGDQVRTLTIRGINFVFGIMLGCFFASILAYFEIPLNVRVWIYLPAMIVTMIFMPKVRQKPTAYIIGSAMVALMAMVGNSLGQEFVTKDIVMERIGCGFLGLTIAITSCNVVAFITKGMVYGERWHKHAKVTV